jgi:hypothetical protein
VLGQARLAPVEAPPPGPVRQLERELAGGRRADLGLDRETARAAAYAGAELRSAEAPCGGGEVGGLEQAGLAGPVRAEQQQRLLRRAPVEPLEAAEVAEAQAAERGRNPIGRAVRSASA